MIPSRGGTADRSRNPAVRLLLDVDSWLVLDEIMAGIPLPPWMHPRWPLGVDRAEQAHRRDTAVQRMRRLGLLTDAPRPGPEAARVVNPSILHGLLVLGTAHLLVAVRSWVGDRAVLSYLAVTGDRACSVIRAQMVAAGPRNHPVVVGDRSGMELSGFLPEDLLDEIMRAVPVAVDTTTRPPLPPPLHQLGPEWEAPVGRHANTRSYDTGPHNTGHYDTGPHNATPGTPRGGHPGYGTAAQGYGTHGGHPGYGTHGGHPGYGTHGGHPDERYRDHGLPPTATGPRGIAVGDDLTMAPEESRLLAAVLREGRDDLLGVMLDGLAGSQTGAPPLLADFAARLHGAVEITVSSTRPGVVARHGLWILTANSTLAVTGPHPQSYGHLRFDPVPPGSVRADVLSAIVTVCGTGR